MDNKFSECLHEMLAVSTCCFVFVFLSANFPGATVGMNPLFDVNISLFILSGQLKHSLMSH